MDTNKYIGHDQGWAAFPKDDEDHQELIDGLSAMVLLGQMPQRMAKAVIKYYQQYHPGEGKMDKETLRVIRFIWIVEQS